MPVTSEKNAEPPCKTLCMQSMPGRLSRFSENGQRGNVLFYIFLAVALLAALSFTFAKDSRQGANVQVAVKAAEELYSQVNMIRSAIVECAVEYPQGGGDLNNDALIDATDNPNNPYPVVPTYVCNPVNLCTTPAANDDVRNLSCTGAPAGKRNMFQGVKNKGRYLPPPPAGFNEWTYVNDADGVRIQIIGTGSTAADALNRVLSRFAACQAELNYGLCGAQCFTVWVSRNVACP